MSTLRSIFVLALAYLVTGKLALMLALPPGYASAIFPPAGIALAALTSRGARLIPGVGLGAFALNALTGIVPGAGLSTATLLAAVIVMVGSSLQAWCGSRLLRRHVPLVLSSTLFITMYIKTSGWEQEQQMLGFRLKSQQVGDMLQYEFGEHERLLYTMANLLQQGHLIAPANFSSMARTYLDARPELR